MLAYCFSLGLLLVHLVPFSPFPFMACITKLSTVYFTLNAVKKLN